QGDVQTCLDQTHKVVLTQSLAEKYFPDDNPLNQSLEIDYEHFLGSGIIPDFPQQTSFQGDFILSHALREMQDSAMVNWHATSTPILVKLDPQSDLKDLGQKITELVVKHAGEYYAETSFSLLPLAQYRTQDPAFSKQLKIISWIGILVLLIAAINVSNLLTAGAYTRLKGLGVMKTLGASKFGLRRQLINESIILSFLGSILGFLLADILFPAFSELMNLPGLNEIPIPFYQYGIMVAVCLVLGIFTGLYPAWYLPRISIPHSLKGKLPRDPKGEVFQNGLVLLQFGVSVVLLIGALFVYQQLSYMRQKELNIDTEQIYSVQVDPTQFEQPDRILQYIPTLKARLASHAQISHVSSSMFVPYHNYMWGNMMESEETGEQFHLHFGVVDENFPHLFDLTVLEGKSFADSLGGQARPQILVNEAFVEAIGWEEAIGKPLDFIGETYEVMGIVKDFHFMSLDQPIKPLVYILGDIQDKSWWNWHRFISLKIQPGNLEPVMAFVNQELQTMDPGFPYETFFVDDEYEQQYRWVEQRSILASILSFLAIGIALMGLFGLMAYMTYQRTKEIGIRKILGATVSQLIQYFTGKFSLPLFGGALLAVPIAYLIISDWLQDFAYRINISPLNFLLGAGIALSIALIIVLQHVWKVANMHPVEALRDE
ncbi:MAG: FtsX-like permease family protein, partial [Bacteroidota bacterium]